MDIEHTTLSARITSFVEGLDGKDCTLGELSEAFGEKGFGMLLLLLAFPAALPIPAPGYATPSFRSAISDSISTYLIPSRRPP